MALMEAAYHYLKSIYEKANGSEFNNVWSIADIKPHVL